MPAICEAEANAYEITSSLLLLAPATRSLKLYLQMGHPDLAAGAIEGVLKNNPKAGNWAQAAMSRLNRLYDAGRFGDIVEEWLVYQADERCKAMLPQMMYIAWKSYRHENKTQEAREVQKNFLESFPNNLLCADMYLASAMDAVAVGQYDEALRLLGVIEVRYPISQVFEKAKSVKKLYETMLR